MKRVIPLLILLLGLPLCASAEYVYVTDRLKVTMRSGESATHKIVRMLNSGTRLEVISKNSATGYTKVRTVSGKEGYVLTRQLLKQPVARERIAELEQRLKELQEAPDQENSKYVSLEKDFTDLKTEHDQLQAENSRLKQELAGIKRSASDSIRLSNERNELRKQVAEMTRQLEDQKQENRESTNKSAQNWFMIGGAVVIAGILIGLILPHLRVGRRHSSSSWDSL